MESEAWLHNNDSVWVRYQSRMLMCSQRDKLKAQNIPYNPDELKRHIFAFK